jgi:hypothetical protein
MALVMPVAMIGAITGVSVRDPRRVERRYLGVLTNNTLHVCSHVIPLLPDLLV